MWLVNISGLTADRSHDEHPPRNSQTKGCESSGTSRPWCNWKRTPWAPGEAIPKNGYFIPLSTKIHELEGTCRNSTNHLSPCIQKYLWVLSTNLMDFDGFRPQLWNFLLPRNKKSGSHIREEGTKLAVNLTEHQVPQFWQLPRTPFGLTEP